MLRERLNGHRHKIKENKLKTPLVSHFNLPQHSFLDIEIQIHETLLTILNFSINANYFG